MLDTYGRKHLQPVFDKLSRQLIKKKITPIKITLGALAIGLASITALYFDQRLVAVLLLWTSGLLDALDGTVARLSNQKSDLGAFLDITFDRIIELGIIIVLALTDTRVSVMLVILTASIVMSMTIFLTVGSFAKNHTHKSFYYQAGLAERTEGFIFFTGLMLFPTIRLWVGYVFAIIIVFTAMQRFLEGIRLLKDK